MPTYEYRCKACEHEFELFQSMKDKPIRKCPNCGKASVERLIGIGAAVVFKGSGFYQTDYRSESYKQAAKADQSASQSPASSGDAAAAGTASPSKAESPTKTDTKSKTEATKPTKKRASSAKKDSAS